MFRRSLKTLSLLFVPAFALPLALSFGLSISQSEARASESIFFVSCHDGDTCLGTRPDGSRIKVRISGIDAPEVGHDFSDESIRFVESLVRDQYIDVECDGASYARQTCFLSKEGMDINAEIVRMGYAWDFPRHSNGKYQTAEAEARIHKRGLWAGSNIVSPFCQRRMTPYSEKMCKTNPQYQD
jgi:endonuclease YncB( thermonuclease family)